MSGVLTDRNVRPSEWEPLATDPHTGGRAARPAMARWLAGAGTLGFIAATVMATPPPPATAAPAPSVTKRPAASSPALRAAPADASARLTWLVGLISAPSRTALEVNFTTSFLKAVPPQAVLDAIGQATKGSIGPWRIVQSNLTATGGQALIAPSRGTSLVLKFELEAGAPHRISAATIEPMPDLEAAFTKPGTLAEVDAALTKVARTAVYGIYDVSNGGCTPLRTMRPDVVMPLGSAFKLWILDALAREIDEKRASWSEPFAVQDRYRSSPDGRVYPLASGTPLTLERFAALMISVSDNTATDHLLGRIGRERVEAAARAAGVRSVGRNTPMLSTADLFRMKWIEPKVGEQFLEQRNPESARAFLATHVDVIPLPWVADPNAVLPNLGGPRRIDALEWFATPADMCVTMSDLNRLSKKPGLEPIARILSENPGLPFPSGHWSTVRFKGGSEPGVFTLVYWLQRADGKRIVVAIGLSDPATAIDESAAVQASARLLGLAHSL